MDITGNEFSATRRLILTGAGVVAFASLGVIPFNLPEAFAAALEREIQLADIEPLAFDLRLF